MSFDLSLKKGDISIATDGTLEIVSDNSKIRQDIVKILLTGVGENRFHKNYGSYVGLLKIGHHADSQLVELDLKSSVVKAVKKIMSLQRSQMRRQFVSPGELIIDILDVQAARDTTDPRLYNIYISVLTQELTEVRDMITVRIA